MPERIHDVVVVGAGPAGARVARDLALRGFDVVVLEEHSVVGTPCHCSGLVTPRTLDLAGVGDDVILNTISGAVIHVPGCPTLMIGGDRVHAHVIDRSEFDRRIVAQATDAGADLQRLCRFEGFTIEGVADRHLADGRIAIDIRREGVPDRIHARLLVGADGGLSRVATQIRGHRPRNVLSGLGGVAEYERNERMDHVELFLDPGAAPGWFGWTIPLDPTRSRIGTGTGEGLKPLESFRRLRDGFPDTFGTARVEAHSGGTIALWEPTPMVSERVMLVGDAARQVKPVSGGGIHAALHAAGIAAEVAGSALERGTVAERSLRPYAERWHATAGRELRRQADMRRAYRRLSIRDLQALMPMLQEQSIRSTVDRDGDIDFPSRLVGRIARQRPSLLLKLFPWTRFPMAWADFA